MSYVSSLVSRDTWEWSDHSKYNKMLAYFLKELTTRSVKFLTALKVDYTKEGSQLKVLRMVRLPELYNGD